jgi:hypothetical protein
MSFAKLVALSLAVSKGSAIPRSTSLAKKGKHFFNEMDKQLANTDKLKNAEIRDAINVLKRFRKNKSVSNKMRTANVALNKISRAKSSKRSRKSI